MAVTNENEHEEEDEEEEEEALSLVWPLVLSSWAAHCVYTFLELSVGEVLVGSLSSTPSVSSSASTSATDAVVCYARDHYRSRHTYRPHRFTTTPPHHPTTAATSLLTNLPPVP